MNYVSVESISKTYGTKVLFKDLTFGISKGQRIALVAKNGAGKSSLLKILTGKETPDKGKFSMRKDINMAYLDQNPDFDENKSIWDTIYNSQHPVLKAVKTYEEILIAYEKDHSELNANKLEAAQSEMDKLQAWDHETRLREILSRLQIADFDKPVSALSGGQKKRLALAALLINEPDLILLDEPTNHLDIQMIEWLEGYLVGRDITMLLVTHDRYFLDRVCTEVMELEDGKMYHYKGDFAYYIEKKAEREMGEASELDKAKNLYRRELEWARRMPKARTTKSKARMDAFDVVSEKAKVRKPQAKLHLDVKMQFMGGKILELIKVSKSYGEKKLMDNFSYIFKKNDKIGIVGKNGAGKSTLLNLIMGLDKPDFGKITSGETIIFGYYAQEGMKLNEDKRVIEVVKDIAEFIPMANGTKLSASQLLLRFQFPPDVQYNYVSKLSGGEKRRLFLLTILVKNPNFLILDEPTNDLDIVTLNVLEDFLELFQGCVLIVSHDRYFMDKIVDHLFVFEGEGVIRDFPGNYSDYRELLDEEEDQKKLAAKPVVNKPAPVVKEEKKTTEPEKRKASYKERTEFELLEKEIAELGQEKTNLEVDLASGSSDHEEVIKISNRIGEISLLLEEKELRWLELSELM